MLTTMRIVRYCNVIPATMKELSEYTGLTVQNIGLIVKDMVEMGVLTKREELKEGKTRPAQLYEYNRDFKW